MENFENDNLSGVYHGDQNPNLPLKHLAAKSIIGEKVRNAQDENLGHIEDFMVDITTGKIEYFVLSYGGFLTVGTKFFAIPFGLLTVNTEKKVFILNQPREILEKAPGFDMNHWPETNFHAEQTYWSFV